MNSTVRGKVEDVNLNPKKSYYGVRIDGEWFNGELDGAVTAEHVKDFRGMKLRLEVNGSDDFIDIENVRVEENKDASQKNKEKRVESDASPGEGSVSDSAGVNSSTPSNNKNVLSPTQANITAQASVKLAVEHVSTRPEESVGEHIEEVNELARGYANIMKSVTEEHIE